MKRKTSVSADTPAERRRELALECARLFALEWPGDLEAVAASVMRAIASAVLRRHFGGEATLVERQARLFTGNWPLWPDMAQAAALRAALQSLGAAFEDAGIREIGCVYETLIGTGGRKRSGSFYTPPELAASVVRVALGARLERAPGESNAARVERLSAISICDPALGAGAFLVETAALLATPEGGPSRRHVVERCLFGVDKNELAVAVAEVAVWLFSGAAELQAPLLRQHLLHADALQLDFRAAFPAVFGEASGFDVVLGNPPWVAFAGRAAQTLDPEERARYARFRSFRGYPTLHALFVERCAELTPHGTLALLLPSPVSDLDGYRAVRQTLTRTHLPREPLMEYGQDAFRSVTQPCFALIADAGSPAAASDRAWRLVERQRAASEAQAVEAPTELLQLLEAEPLPAALFGEMGFQTSRVASETLLRRAPDPDEQHRYPLLEGRDVQEFCQGRPKLFLRADPALLRAAGCRLRPLDAYRRVAFVVRQTASFPIAALHGGLPFRNTLLAGFALDELAPELMVGLLNSTLYRALHLAARRDARQAVFPQVKIRHLRSLPRPPREPAGLSRIAELSRSMTSSGPSPALRAELDDSVFSLFGLRESVKLQIDRFVAERVRPPKIDRQRLQRFA